MTPATGTMELPTKAEAEVHLPVRSGATSQVSARAPVIPRNRKAAAKYRWAAFGVCVAAAAGVIFAAAAHRVSHSRFDTVAARREVLAHPIVLRGDLEAVE